jgi:hypothetical protein
MRRPLPPILSPSTRTFVELTPRQWVCWWEAAVHGEPRTVCVRPPTSLYALATGAHQP